MEQIYVGRYPEQQNPMHTPLAIGVFSAAPFIDSGRGPWPPRENNDSRMCLRTVTFSTAREKCFTTGRRRGGAGEGIGT